MKICNILKKYNLDITDIKQINRGYSAQKWILIDKNNNSYLIKKIDIKHKKNFPFALEIQEKLIDESTEIIKTIDGKLCVFETKNIFYITKLLKCKRHIYTAYEIGQYLGCLHKKMEKIKYNDKIDYIMIENNLKKIRELIHNTNGIINEILIYKERISESIINDSIDYSRLTLQIIHGDYYKDNLIYTTNGIKIIDFDQCCFFYREYEMLRGFFISIFDESKTPLRNIKEFKKYICSYKKSIKKIDAENTYKLYVFIQTNSLAGIISKPIDFKFASKRYEILKFLLNNKNKIIQIISDN